MSESGERYAAETQRVAELQHFDVTQGLTTLFRGTQWTVEPLSFVEGRKSMSASVWHDLIYTHKETLRQTHTHTQNTHSLRTRCRKFL